MGNNRRGKDEDNKLARIKHFCKQMHPNTVAQKNKEGCWLSYKVQGKDKCMSVCMCVLTAQAYSTNYFQSLISDSSDTAGSLSADVFSPL